MDRSVTLTTFDTRYRRRDLPDVPMMAPERRDRPTTEATIGEFHQVLVAAARSRASQLGTGAVVRSRMPRAERANLEAVVDTASAAAADLDSEAQVEQFGAAIASVQEGFRVRFREARTELWSACGALMPVLAGSVGAGGSTIAAVLTNTLQQAGRRVLLVDADDSSRARCWLVAGRGAGGMATVSARRKRGPA